MLHIPKIQNFCSNWYDARKFIVIIFFRLIVYCVKSEKDHWHHCTLFAELGCLKHEIKAMFKTKLVQSTREYNPEWFYPLKKLFSDYKQKVFISLLCLPK